MLLLRLHRAQQAYLVFFADNVHKDWENFQYQYLGIYQGLNLEQIEIMHHLTT